MNKNLIPLTTAAYLAMTAVHAADPEVLIPPKRYSAAHTTVPLAEIVTFDAPKVGYPFTFSGTMPTDINNRGDIVGSYTDGTADGYVRFDDGTLILANAPVAGQQSTLAWAINDLNEFTGFCALAVP